jgi:restriction modification system DNA specificity domain protein
MTKKPSYRFAAYTESWEEKKLGEVIDINSGEAPAKFHEGYTPYVKVDDLNYCDKYLTATKTYVDTNNKIKKIEKGSIVFPKRGAAILTNKIRILNTKAYMDTNMMSLSTDKSNLEFLYTLISNVGLYKIADTSTIPQINNKHILPYIISLPSLPEQTAIGSFFQDIDQLISLQQRKLEVLKEQKKTYLKLLFPVKGQTKPALRFAGFEDEWKEVKLGEIGEIQTGNTPPTNEEDNYEKNGFPWVTPTDINSLVLHTTSKQLSEVGKSKARIAKSGSILVTCIASIGKNTLVRTDSAFNQQINSLTPSEKYSSYFLLTQSEIWSRYMLSVAGAGTMQIINKSDFSNIKAMVPSLPEQEAIGSFFQDLDKAIAKQEEKVNQLKESKQTLLRKMFI